MSESPFYPFSDLTPQEMQSLKEIARRERLEALRAIFRALGGWGRKVAPWPPRAREAQVWPPKNVPALSLTSYR